MINLDHLTPEEIKELAQYLLDFQQQHHDSLTGVNAHNNTPENVQSAFWQHCGNVQAIREEYKLPPLY